MFNILKDNHHKLNETLSAMDEIDGQSRICSSFQNQYANFLDIEMRIKDYENRKHQYSVVSTKDVVGNHKPLPFKISKSV